MGQLKVLFFGAARKAANCSEAVVPCEEGIKMDAEAVWDKLIHEYPPLGPLRKSTRMARNHEYLPDDGLVAAGDEIALIPPVSGG